MNPQTHARLSLAMIVRDAAEPLADTLESMQGVADEIVIVDTGSTDDTREIARRYGAKVVDFRWVDSFAAARTESLRHATGDWILWLDADENQIKQVIWNIASNGLRAMSSGGRLVLSVERDVVDGHEEVVLGVSDTGRGIPADEIDSIFQPFKSSFDRGTGL